MDLNTRDHLRFIFIDSGVVRARRSHLTLPLLRAHSFDLPQYF
jgi:hypothetical protein